MEMFTSTARLLRGVLEMASDGSTMPLDAASPRDLVDLSRYPVTGLCAAGAWLRGTGTYCNAPGM